MGKDTDIIERLYATIASRKGADPKTSYTAKLFERGRGQINKKIGEEAAETMVASLAQSRTDVISESGDLIYHLLVLWAEHDIAPEDVWAELEGRFGTSGIDEKRARKKKKNPKI